MLARGEGWGVANIAFPSSFVNSAAFFSPQVLVSKLGQPKHFRFSFRIDVGYYFSKHCRSAGIGTDGFIRIANINPECIYNY